MYAPSQGQKCLSASASIAVVALVGLLLARSLTVPILRLTEPATLAVLAPEPPPPEPAKPPEPRKAEAPKHKAAQTKGAQAAPSPVPAPVPAPFLPTPAIALPAPVVAPSGGGANGAGTGLGTGTSGDGSSADDDGGNDTPPRRLRGKLAFADLPSDLRAASIDRTVTVRYAVATDGHVENCAVTAPSGSPELDALTCRLIEQRFRFTPSRDDHGQPVRSIIVEQHSWRTIRTAGG